MATANPLAALGSAAGMPLSPAEMQDMYGMQMMRGLSGVPRGIAPGQAAGLQAMDQGVANISPAMQRQRDLYNTMRGITADTPQRQGESPTDYNIRLTTALAHAAAKIDPNAAVKLLDRREMLLEQQKQQNLLQAETGLDQKRSAYTEAETENAGEDTALKKFQLGQAETAAKGGIPALVQDQKGQFSAYNLADPQSRAQYLRAQQAGGIPWTQKGYEAYMAAKERMFVSLGNAQMNYGTYTPTVIAHAALQSLFHPGILEYRGPEKAWVQGIMSAANITPAETEAVQNESKALSVAANQAGSRAGRIQYINNEIVPLGKQVTALIDQNPRTDFTLLNNAIRAGRTSFSNPNEAKLAAAMQALVNTYARLISGGSNITSDAAREEAWSILRKGQGPAGIKAAVSQIVNKEAKIVDTAAPAAVAMMTDPNRFRNMIDAQNKLKVYLSHMGAQANQPLAPNFVFQPMPGSTQSATTAQAPNAAPAASAAPAGAIPKGWTFKVVK